MKLENQVCSLELAKQLKELGVKQESLFYYRGLELNKQYEGKLELYYGKPKDYSWLVSAFTVAELGEMLPVNIKIEKWDLHGHGLVWNINCEDAVDDQDDDFEVYANSEADARAKIIIYLLESKIIQL